MSAILNPAPILPRPGAFRLRAKITFPYVLLALLVGMVAAYILTRVVMSSVEARFERQLADAGHQATDGVVAIEKEHLALWRRVRYTQGLAEAVARGDGAEAGSIAALEGWAARIDALDLVDARGDGLWAMHRAAGEGDTYDFSPWPAYGDWRLVQDVLAGEADAEGDKYADLIRVTPSEGSAFWMVYTAGPVKSGDRVVGVLLVGTRLERIVQRLDEGALARVTVYDADGRPLASTLGAVAGDDYRQLTPLETPMAVRAATVAADAAVQRSVEVGTEPYAELLTTFLVRGDDMLGLLGVAQLSNVVVDSIGPMRTQMIALFTTAIVATLLIGAFLSAQITRPVQQLMQASQAVAAGDLAQRVDVRTGDEIGVLAHAFNGMVDKLRERQWIIRLFGQYVGDEVVAAVLAGRVPLGGERRTVSILFADIRGFSTLAERSDARKLLATLNEYFTDMADVIGKAGGLVNKFGGDSTLAVFGVPLEERHHAVQAVRAALDMMSRLEDLNTRRGLRREAPIRIGIGINSGEVIAGNVGPEERHEYTVIGDAVNVAQRLSDLNRDSALYSIFISESTLQALGGFGTELSSGGRIADLGEVQVKGKAEPVRVYAVFTEVPAGVRG